MSSCCAARILVGQTLADRHPLVTTSAIRPEPRLNPILIVRGQQLYLSPTEMFTISTKYLRNPITNLEAERYRIISALDLVFAGI